MTFKTDCLLGKQETNRFVWFSLIRLKIFLVVVLIQSVSSQISSTLIHNSLAGCTASSTVAGMLLPPGAPLLCQSGSLWLLRPAPARCAVRVTLSSAGAFFRGCGLPTVSAGLWQPPSPPSPSSSVPTSVRWLRTWPIKHQTGLRGSAGGSSEAAPHCLFCSFYSLLSALGPSHFFAAFSPSPVILVFLTLYPCPAHNAVCEHGGNPSPA